MTATLTLRELAPMMREAMRDKSYEATPLGGEVAAYLRWKSKSCAKNTLLAYESTLAAFALEALRCGFSFFGSHNLRFGKCSLQVARGGAR